MKSLLEISLLSLIRFLIITCWSGIAVLGIRIDGPKFKEVSTVSRYNVGDTAILFCSVTNLGKRTVSWRKLPDPNPLTVGLTTWVKDNRIHVEHVPNSQQWNLIIENTELHDEGLYVCQVNMKGKKLKQRVELKLKDLMAKRHARVQIIGANDIRRGSVIYIVCNVTILEGETEGVQWLKDDVRLDNIESNRISIKNSVTYNARVNDVITSRLSIKSADVSDSGYYMCQSSDGYQMAGIKVQILSGSHNTKRAGKMQEMKVVGSKSNGSLSRAFNSLPLLNYVYVLVLIFYTIL